MECLDENKKQNTKNYQWLISIFHSNGFFKFWLTGMEHTYSYKQAISSKSSCFSLSFLKKVRMHAAPLILDLIKDNY
jgi:hypothetical protein